MLQRLKSWIHLNYRIFSKEEYAVELKKIMDHPERIIHLYHGKKKLLLMVKNTYCSVDATEDLLNLSPLEKHSYAECTECQEAKINESNSQAYIAMNSNQICEALVQSYDSHFHYLQQLRRLRIRTGTETKEERTTRENVVYTTAMKLSTMWYKLVMDKKKETLSDWTVGGLAESLSGYLYKYLTTEYIHGDFHFVSYYPNNPTLTYLSQVISYQPHVDLIHFYSRNIKVHYTEWENVYVCGKSVPLLEKPRNHRLYPDIKANRDPFLDCFLHSD